MQIVDVSGDHFAVLHDLTVEAETVALGAFNGARLPHLRLVVVQAYDFKGPFVIPSRECVAHKGWVDITWGKRKIFDAVKSLFHL